MINKIIINLQILKKARADFLKARGRYHLQLLKKFQSKLEKDCRKISKEIKKIKKEIEKISKERESKKEIFKKYEEIQFFQKKLEQALKNLKEIKYLKEKVEKEIEKLEQVRLIDFIKIHFKKDFLLREKVENYLIGVFPEWEPMPEWFKILIKKYNS